MADVGTKRIVMRPGSICLARAIPEFADADYGDLSFWCFDVHPKVGGAGKFQVLRSRKIDIDTHKKSVVSAIVAATD